jgi:hypothetical protein
MTQDFVVECTSSTDVALDTLTDYTAKWHGKGEDLSNCPTAILPAAVAYTLSMPCTPVCEPSLPECLDEPLFLVADIGYDDICIYDMTPVSKVTMDGPSVTFEILTPG